MKKILLCGLIYLAILNVATAQTFKTTFDPNVMSEGAGYGFFADFEFSIAGVEKGTNAVNIQLNSVKIDFDKGYFRKFFSKPVGKLYKCTQLAGLCAETKIIGFWIHIVWEYNGVTYENRGQFTGRQRGDNYEYTNVLNPFTAPSDIPVSGRQNAVIKKITISSCSFNTTDKIEDIVQTLN